MYSQVQICGTPTLLLGHHHLSFTLFLSILRLGLGGRSMVRHVLLLRPSCLRVQTSYDGALDGDLHVFELVLHGLHKAIHARVHLFLKDPDLLLDCISAFEVIFLGDHLLRDKEALVGILGFFEEPAVSTLEDLHLQNLLFVGLADL